MAESADNSNSWYVAMHLDRLSDELLAETYGKREEQKKKKAEYHVEIINSEGKTENTN